MLNSHPEIAAPPECGFLQWWHAKYNSWSGQSGDSLDLIGTFVSDLLTSRKIETWHLDKNSLILFLQQHHPSSYGELSLLVYLFWANSRGRNPQVVVDKNNYYIRHLPQLEAIWPDARYIHLVRDGRDVACSYQEVSKLDSTSPYRPILPVAVNEIAKEWRENNLTILNFLQALPESKSISLRYEDLVRGPKSSLNKVVAFLGLPFDEKMLLYYTHNDEPAVTLDWKRKTLERPDPNTIGRFRKVLEEKEVFQFEEIAGELLMRYGYGVSKV